MPHQIDHKTAQNAFSLISEIHYIALQLRIHAKHTIVQTIVNLLLFIDCHTIETGINSLNISRIKTVS